MYELMVESSFSAAHYLRGYKGKCESLHGHNFRVQAEVKSRELNELGMVMDFKDLKEVLNEVIKRIDHKNLNELEVFRDENPTSENIAKYIYNQIRKSMSSNFPLFTISKVRVWETDNSCASFGEVV
ncbi:MAG: 6-carboxytetrahydropterin synthase QueD [bacterium]|nr:6-carboxytetrahydropterin synthase QueD [bacterium]